MRPSTRACNRHTRRPSQPSIPAAVACLSRHCSRPAALRSFAHTFRVSQIPIAEARGAFRAPSPAGSFLGGFRTPATVYLAPSIMAGIRNPAHFASIPRCPSYVRLDSESGGKADIVRGRICAPTTDIGATVPSRRAPKKTSRLRLGARTFGDTTPADVEVTENSIDRPVAHSRYRQEAQRRDERRPGGPTPNVVSHRDEPKT